MLGHTNKWAHHLLNHNQSQVPVPDEFVQSVSHWMYTLAEGYTDDVRNTIEGAATEKEAMPQAVATIYVREDEISA
ncbi:hypothetical protein PROFUN_15380 [Planoprotostelium fungivorum]|uniref:Uncharacterized protein n=1 Tax=Planoprotostelium fungivorum TaxID=1890364 RepID=A0A2P6MWQ4_9EUKA|nr:hypothetical protein PROFUN_15380 [Planoprotostelium fungivorum]